MIILRKKKRCNWDFKKKYWEIKSKK